MRMSLKYSLALALLFTAVSFGGPLRAQTSLVWQKMPKDSLTVLISNGGMLYGAGTSGGVEVSRDSGATWVQLIPGYPPIFKDLCVFGSTLVAVSPSPVFAAYYTTNSGTTWLASVANAGSGTAIGPLTCRDSSLFIGSIPGVLRSRDSGKTWKSKSTGFGSGNAAYVRSFASLDSFIFAGTDMGGIYRTSDDGDTWTAVNNGLSSLQVLAMATEGKTLFAGTDVNHGGVFRSTDYGNSWTNVSSELPDPTFASAMSSVGHTVIAATDGPPTDVYATTDDGGSWTIAETGLPRNLSISSMISQGDLIFAVTDSGLFRTRVSSTASVNELATNSSTISVHIAPNPVSDVATLTINGTSPQAVHVALYDILGQRIEGLGYSGQLSQDALHIPLTLQSLPAGMYYLRIETDGDVKMMQVVKR